MKLRSKNAPVYFLVDESLHMYLLSSQNVLWILFLVINTESVSLGIQGSSSGFIQGKIASLSSIWYL